MSAADQDLHGRWIREKDAGAFAELVRAHGPMVYGTCRRVLGDATEAEDLTQECFWKFAREARPVRSVGAWLHTVATRLCINRLRTDNRRRARERRYSDRQVQSTEEQEWGEVSCWVDEAIDGLPEDIRDLIVLHYFEGVTHAELGTKLNVSPSTVSRRIQRGVERIRHELVSRGMPIGLGALAAGLGAEANAELPALTHQSLMKIGLSAGQKQGATISAATGSFTATKTLWVATALPAIAMLGWLLAYTPPKTTQITPAPASQDFTGPAIEQSNFGIDAQ